MNSISSILHALDASIAVELQPIRELLRQHFPQASDTEDFTLTAPAAMALYEASEPCIQALALSYRTSGFTDEQYPYLTSLLFQLRERILKKLISGDFPNIEVVFESIIDSLTRLNSPIDWAVFHSLLARVLGYVEQKRAEDLALVGTIERPISNTPYEVRSVHDIIFDYITHPTVNEQGVDSSREFQDVTELNRQINRIYESLGQFEFLDTIHITEFYPYFLNYILKHTYATTPSAEKRAVLYEIILHIQQYLDLTFRVNDPEGNPLDDQIIREILRKALREESLLYIIPHNDAEPDLTTVQGANDKYALFLIFYLLIQSKTHLSLLTIPNLKNIAKRLPFTSTASDELSQTILSSPKQKRISRALSFLGFASATMTTGYIAVAAYFAYRLWNHDANALEAYTALGNKTDQFCSEFYSAYNGGDGEWVPYQVENGGCADYRENGLGDFLTQCCGLLESCINQFNAAYQPTFNEICAIDTKDILLMLLFMVLIIIGIAITSVFSRAASNANNICNTLVRLIRDTIRTFEVEKERQLLSEALDHLNGHHANPPNNLLQNIERTLAAHPVQVDQLPADHLSISIHEAAPPPLPNIVAEQEGDIPLQTFALAPPPYVNTSAALAA